ncbi:MAG: hypothetical protein ABI890_06600, partial [Lapillicoccus sp.]
MTDVIAERTDGRWLYYRVVIEVSVVNGAVMARPVVTTKLYVPRVRPGVVSRPRLREMLRRGAGSRLTLVSAPAGFGKTTLLAEWLAETAGEDHLVAW